MTIQRNGIQLLKAGAATGDWFQWPYGSEGILMASGTPDSSTLTIEMKNPISGEAILVTKTDGTTLSITSEHNEVLQGLSRGVEYRAAIASAGGSTSWDVYLGAAT